MRQPPPLYSCCGGDPENAFEEPGLPTPTAVAVRPLLRSPDKSHDKKGSGIPAATRMTGVGARNRSTPTLRREEPGWTGLRGFHGECFRTAPKRAGMGVGVNQRIAIGEGYVRISGGVPLQCLGRND